MAVRGKDQSTYRTQLAHLGCLEPLVARWASDYSRFEHTLDFDAHGLVLRGAFTLTTASGSRMLQAGNVFELAAGTARSEQACGQAAESGALEVQPGASSVGCSPNPARRSRIRAPAAWSATSISAWTRTDFAS